MEEEKALAVFGGAFNPPLCSHFSMAEQILNEFEEIERVVFVPVNSKYNKQGLIENEHRYNMLKLVCEHNPRFEVSDVEIRQGRQLYTIETLELLEHDWPGYKLYFVIGSDNLKELYWWHEADRLLRSYKIIVVERDEDVMEDIIENDDFLKEYKYKDVFIKCRENIKSNMSSTYVRKKLMQGKSIRYLTPDEVYYYIQDNYLYQ